MLRARLAKAVLVAGVGLLSGCASLSNHPLVGWFHHKNTTVIGESCEGPICDGPVLQDYGPYPTTGAPMMQGGTCGPMIGTQPMPGMPPQGMPPMGTAPRIEPLPAQPEPFRPMMREFR